MNNTLLRLPDKADLQAGNKIAAMLSVLVPGLGQVYKGHVSEGLLWLFLGMPVAIWIGILLGLATAGIGLLFPLVCWAALAVDAYYEKDRRAHHWLMPTSGDESLDNVQD